ncbi:hypothetical protein DFS34DRAFT_429522 [Phlyctochytrium arcticum]|nr:hypothetical protein DFS34DRAFT_429522 [Phlyctochytrium arcticum]
MPEKQSAYSQVLTFGCNPAKYELYLTGRTKFCSDRIVALLHSPREPGLFVLLHLPNNIFHNHNLSRDDDFASASPAHRPMCHGILSCLQHYINAASAILKTILIGNDGICIAIFHRKLNDASKFILLVLYLLLLGTFLQPVLKHMHSLSRSGISSQKFREIAMSVAGKISFVVICFSITISLSWAGLFGSYFYVEFLIEDYCCLAASTWCTEGNETGKAGTVDVQKSALNILKPKMGVPSARRTAEALDTAAEKEQLDC